MNPHNQQWNFSPIYSSPFPDPLFRTLIKSLQILWKIMGITLPITYFQCPLHFSLYQIAYTVKSFLLNTDTIIYVAT